MNAIPPNTLLSTARTLGHESSIISVLYRSSANRVFFVMQLYIFTLVLLLGSAVTLAQRTIGLISHDAANSFQGYTLFAPITSTTTYLINNEGQVIKTWQSGYGPGQAVMLLEDGSLLRTAAPPSQSMQGGGAGGMVEIYEWTGTKLWSYTHLTPTARQHHDVEIMPNGNILLLVWESHTRDEAIAAGRQAARLTENALWSERVIEVRRTGPTSGEVVWSWSSWDHMVQDSDPSKANYGVVADSPDRIDINAGGTRSDWLHANSVRYNAKRDEVMISIHNLNEIWIISRKTGDIVYRYGSPANYKSGTPQEQTLFGQHDARWLEEDDTKVTIFNNGMGRVGVMGSSVDEIVLPLSPDGSYKREPKKAFAPARPTVVYPKTLTQQFYGQNISGATRMPNGNTLSCLGPSGTFVETTPEGAEVWRYVNPVTNTGIAPQGQTPRNNMVFKIYRYAPDYPAFAGRTILPRGRLEDGPLSVADSEVRRRSDYLVDPVNDRVVFRLESEQSVTIDAYNVLGQHLESSAEEVLPPGVHVRPIPHGTIIVRLR